MSIIDYLNHSAFDELAEIDLIDDRYHNIYHVEGKYFVPIRNSAFSDIYRYSLEYMIHPEDRETGEELMRPDTLLARLEKAEPPGILRAQLRYKLLDGNWRWVEQIVAGGAQHGFGEGVVRFFLFDIQNKKDRQMGRVSAFSSSGDRDEITGLLYRKPFFTAAQNLIRDKSGDWCLISIDIEHFKLFNEWYGRESGDFLLAQIGSVLKREENRSGGLAGYIGQDDFCILLPYDKAGIERLYAEIQHLTMSQEISVGFMPTFGITLVGRDDSIMDALDRSSIAADEVKGDFHSRIRYYKPSMRNRTEQEYRMLSDFQRGLENQELYFYLQPQCLVPTGQVVGAESLARWKTPEGKLVPPDVFVPLLEKYGFITDLDEYIWEGVCAWLHDWIQAGHTPVPISVNVSQIDIFSIDVPDFMERLVTKYELPRDMLKIEITESAYVDDTNVVKEAVQRLREMGFLVLMDDFGSGYSSLNMLRKLNVDVIKLDAQFLRLSDLDGEKGIHILETVVNMTKTMAVPLIVEGVESAEQASFLEQLGCRYIQGYHYYQPMPVSDFEKLISDERNIDTRGFSFIANQQFSVREFMDENIYSDSMLNNILGAAAIYCWDGTENVDIVRFNEQFYHLVNVPDFEERLTQIQRFFHPNDVRRFYDMLAAAEKDRLNGSSGMVGVYRTDGSLGQFYMHFYYLEEGETGKIFYGAMRELTEFASLQNQIRLLSRVSSESVVFLSGSGDKRRYRVVVHGLADRMGLSREEFERELNEGSFCRRLDGEAGRLLRELSLNGAREQTSWLSSRMSGEAGAPVELYIKIDYVHDENSGVDSILLFRPQAEA